MWLYCSGSGAGCPGTNIWLPLPNSPLATTGSYYGVTDPFFLTPDICLQAIRSTGSAVCQTHEG